MHNSAPPQPKHFLPQRDLIGVLIATLLVAALSMRFEWSEKVFSVTRGLEAAQVDEWTLTVFSLAAGLAWLSWRRSRQAQTQVQAHLLTQQQLAVALADNQHLAHATLRSVEAERKRLARELHDELGQYSNAIKLDACSIVAHGCAHHPQNAAAAERIVHAADHLHAVVGDLIKRLRPTGLDELGLVAAVESCIDRWQQALPETAFELQVLGEFDDLGELTTLTLFRIAQEGLTNCARHSGASQVKLKLLRHSGQGGKPDQLQVCVEDDGRGCEASQHRNGHGLRGIAERVTQMGGQWSVRTAPGEGFTMQACIAATGHD